MWADRLKRGGGEIHSKFKLIVTLCSVLSRNRIVIKHPHRTAFMNILHLNNKQINYQNLHNRVESTSKYVIRGKFVSVGNVWAWKVLSMYKLHSWTLSVLVASYLVHLLTAVYGQNNKYLCTIETSDMGVVCVVWCISIHTYYVYYSDGYLLTYSKITWGKVFPLIFSHPAIPASLVIGVS